HRRFQILDCEDDGDNPWQLKYSTLFNSATASSLFLKREDLEREGWILQGDMVFRRPRNTKHSLASYELFLEEVASYFEDAVPLYEGQLANRYDHRARTYAG